MIRLVIAVSAALMAACVVHREPQLAVQTTEKSDALSGRIEAAQSYVPDKRIEPDTLPAQPSAESLSPSTWVHALADASSSLSASIAPLAEFDSLAITAEEAALISADELARWDRSLSMSSNVLDYPPSFEPGTIALLVKLGLHSGYGASIENEFVGAMQDPVELEVDLEGNFGGALGLEVYASRSVSFQIGADYRHLSPANPRAAGEAVDDFFAFDDVTYIEYFFATRFLLPPFESILDRRLRPYLRIKTAFVPEVDSPAVINFNFPSIPGQEPIPNPEFNFKGSEYWTVGGELGLAYFMGDNAMLHLGILFEQPLEDSQDRVEIQIASFTSKLDVSMRPEGFMVVGGVSWGF
ncbi:MAG: hypothetical protein ACI841_000961 [Planctomycetota bacterium]|jgi:hypothetical protein